MLTKDSFPLTHFFLGYQILKNTENYLYTKFSIETNKAYTSFFFFFFFFFSFLQNEDVSILNKIKVCDFHQNGAVLG